MRLILLTLTLFLIGCDEGSIFSSAKFTKVDLEVGKAIITDRGVENDQTSHLNLKCNNGLIIDVDWNRNPYNEYGYDIYEPTVSEDTNRLAVMITVRGVIANYLNGRYAD